MKPKFRFIRQRLGKIKKADLYRRLVANRVDGPYIHFGKRKLVNLCSNDYLGLGNVRIFQAQMQSSSRLVSGNDAVFERLEAALARHKSQQASLVFPTGYMTNLGIIPILPEKGDVILSDELNHASIIESCKLAHARKSIYRHNDVADLKSKLGRSKARKFVITEGIFSMNGDFARLEEITELCQKHGAILILDDAHGDFVAGPDGRGSAAHHGISSKVDVYISSLSKGLGSFGGYVASRKEVIDLAINTSRPFIYTSALPSILARAALDRLSSDREGRRKKLWRNIGLLRTGLESVGYNIESPSQIIPIIIGSEKKSLEFGRFLFDNGVFAQPIRYPTVGRGSARIRLSVTAWLSNENIAKTIDVFGKAGRRFGLT